MNTIIIDYEVGNLTAIGNSLKFLKYDYKISSDPKEIKNAEFIILPGVGSFAAGMENIKKLGLQEPILEAVLEKKTPILGICLGMQLLATESEENGLRTGLNLIPGTVLKIPEDSKLQVPNVGWRDLDRVADPKFFGENRYFYFDHSYHLHRNGTQEYIA